MRDESHQGADGLDDATSSESSDFSIGPYAVRRELGRGGQAVVYLADDPKLDRLVALKVLTGFGALAPDLVERFRREATVTSRLDHPTICSIYDMGLAKGVPYIAMRYVPGRSLARVISDTRVDIDSGDDTDSMMIDFSSIADGASFDATDSTPKTTTPSAVEAVSSVTQDEATRIVRLVADIARGLHVAHEAGIVHRDVKPGNIMVTADGRPVILDFGLAGVEDLDLPALTQSGDVIGTPAYMSPEQIRGESLDPRTDVYSLGVTLYECLTLQRPFSGATRESLYRAILSEEPISPQRLNQSVSRDLAVVLATATAKDVNHRYQSAEHFADDLDRAMRFEPIEARPASSWLKLRRWAQRNPALAATAAGLFFLLVVAAGLLSYGLGAKGKAELAERNAELETEKRARAESDLAAAEAARESLDRDRRKRRFLTSLETIATTAGTNIYGLGSMGIRGGIDPRPIVDAYVAAYRDFGLDLVNPPPTDDIVHMAADIRERDVKFSATFLEGLYDLTELMAGYDVGEAAKARRDGTVVSDEQRAAWSSLARDDTILDLWFFLLDVVERAEPDPWFRRTWRMLVTARADASLAIDEDVIAEAAATKSVEQAQRLIGFALRTPTHRELALTWIETAIDRHPGEFTLRIARAGMGLAKAQEDVEHARHSELHAQVAVGLRPDSGIARSMLGVAQVLQGNYQPALENIDRSVTIEPDSALVGFFRANFYSRSRYPGHDEIARKECRRVLAIDPQFQGAIDLLERLGPSKGEVDPAKVR